MNVIQLNKFINSLSLNVIYLHIYIAIYIFQILNFETIKRDKEIKSSCWNEESSFARFARLTHRLIRLLIGSHHTCRMFKLTVILIEGKTGIVKSNQWKTESHMEEYHDLSVYFRIILFENVIIL